MCSCLEPQGRLEVRHCLKFVGAVDSMSLRLPATLHSWQASFKTCSFAQPLTWGLGRPPQSCEFSNNAQSLAQRRARTPQMPKIATPKQSQTLISGSRKPAAYESLADKLAFRASPTLLYQASSYTYYLFGCYAVGGGLLAAAWFNFRTQFYVQPGGVPQWVPLFTSVGSFMIACGGFWMFLKVRRIASQDAPAVRLTQALATEHGTGHYLFSVFSKNRARI